MSRFALALAAGLAWGCGPLPDEGTGSRPDATVRITPSARADGGGGWVDAGVDAGVVSSARVLALRWLEVPSGAAASAPLSAATVAMGIALAADVSVDTTAVRFLIDGRQAEAYQAPWLWCGSTDGSMAPCLPSLLGVGTHRLEVQARDGLEHWGPSWVELVVVEPLTEAAIPGLFFVNRATQQRTAVTTAGRWPAPAATYSLQLEATDGSAKFEIPSRSFTQLEGRLPFFLCGDQGDGGIDACAPALLAAGTARLTVTRYALPAQTGAQTKLQVELVFP